MSEDDMKQLIVELDRCVLVDANVNVDVGVLQQEEKKADNKDRDQSDLVSECRQKQTMIALICGKLDKCVLYTTKKVFCCFVFK